MAIPNISVRHPRPDDIVDDPVEVAGVGTGFEGTLVARLRNATGQEIEKRSFQAGGTGIWGSFFFRIDVPGIPNRPRGTPRSSKNPQRTAARSSSAWCRSSSVARSRTPITASRCTPSSHATRCRRSPRSSTAIRTASERSSRPTATSSTTPTRSSPDRTAHPPVMPDRERIDSPTSPSSRTT